jgi:AcrR family transcriptional regulator
MCRYSAPMTSMGARLPLRDLTRRAVQAELISVAQQLFDEQGYEDTTVDAIATRAGMSRRSFFRYFASKEELVLGKYDLLGEQLVDALRARPGAEPLWSALQGMFQAVTAIAAPGAATETVHAIERVVDESPSLRAGYLYRLDTIQRNVIAEARDRAARAGTSYDPDDPTPEALVGAAFACMIAARAVAPRSELSWAQTVERAMRAVRS